MPVTRHNVSGSILLGFSVNNFSVLPICYCRLIGRCHFLMGDLDKALESAQQSLSIEHNSSITQFLLFEIYLQQNKEREGFLLVIGRLAFVQKSHFLVQF
jgi:hypothetical protein